MPLEMRPIQPGEYPLALDLWDLAFTPGRSYFERYYRDDPWYQEGDSLGAFDGERLVSAVHVCRRPLEWAGRTLWCGAIANVATHPDYRRQGLSRDLLRLAIRRMEATGLDFSMLFTGQYGHYAALGWEQVVTPRASVTLADPAPIPSGLAVEAAVYGPAAELYWKTPPRPLLLHRPEQYFRGWVEWEWRQRRSRLLWNDEAGYAVLGFPEGAGKGAELVEWFPMDGEAEVALLRGAAALARQEGRAMLRLAALPYYGGAALLQELGEAAVEQAPSMMLRNLRLAPEEYAELTRLYQSGDAACWPSDGF
jgi:predicted N-acetyltransferase YhbS